VANVPGINYEFVSTYVAVQCLNMPLNMSFLKVTFVRNRPFN